MDVLRLNNKFFYIFINFNLNNYLPKVAIYNIYKIQNTQYSNYNSQKNKNPILNLNSLNFNKFINELNFNITKKKQFIDNINNNLNCCVVLNKKDIIILIVSSWQAFILPKESTQLHYLWALAQQPFQEGI